MKISKSDALSATFSRPELRFEQQDLTSFSGLVLFQSLFARLGLYRRLARCFRKRVASPIYPQAKIILLLIVLCMANSYFMQRLESGRAHCSVNAMNSDRAVRVEIELHC